MPRGCRDGEFPDEELGIELVTSQKAARDQMDQATDLETRLPRTWDALAAGLIDATGPGRSGGLPGPLTPTPARAEDLAVAGAGAAL